MQITVLLSIWIMVFGGHQNRLYVLKAPPTAPRTWSSQSDCIADPAAATMPNAKCIEVTDAPSCYNDGSVCKFSPVSDEGKEALGRMVPFPRGP